MLSAKLQAEGVKEIVSGGRPYNLKEYEGQFASHEAKVVEKLREIQQRRALAGITVGRIIV